LGRRKLRLAVKATNYFCGMEYRDGQRGDGDVLGYPSDWVFDDRHREGGEPREILDGRNNVSATIFAEP
jgi:hypothetical protein